MSTIETNLSKGSVPKQLMKFALPFIISNLVQSLYSVADMVIVGQFAGKISMSGVNIGSQVTMLVTNLVIGLAAGATVLIGQYLGADDRKSLKDTIGTLLTLLLVSSVAVTAVMVFLRVPILNLIQTPAPSFNEAKSYLTVTALGTVFIFMYNALSAILRGMGDSKRPLYFVCVAAVVNVVLDLLLVGVFEMAAFGAGLATIISQAVSVVLCIVYLRKRKFIFDFNLRSFGFDKVKTKLLIKIGLPMSAQNVCTSISFLFLTTIVNMLDPTATASAAVGAVGKLNDLFDIGRDHQHGDAGVLELADDGVNVRAG
ncbi:MAG: MATE family efflux transporter, partial [Clostridia bacterium]|nr:MATE family efflux transporter [Clostridia bacterium]